MKLLSLEVGEFNQLFSWPTLSHVHVKLNFSQFSNVWVVVRFSACVRPELRKAEECKSEEAWQEGEESSSELEDEEEHRQNSEAEEEEEEEEEDEEEEEGEHTQDDTHDHMPVFTPMCMYV